MLVMLGVAHALDVRWESADEANDLRFSKRARDADGGDYSRWAQTDLEAKIESLLAAASTWRFGEFR